MAESQRRGRAPGTQVTLRLGCTRGSGTGRSALAWCTAGRTAGGTYWRVHHGGHGEHALVESVDAALAQRVCQAYHGALCRWVPNPVGCMAVANEACVKPGGNRAVQGVYGHARPWLEGMRGRGSEEGRRSCCAGRGQSRHCWAGNRRTGQAGCRTGTAGHVCTIYDLLRSACVATWQSIGRGTRPARARPTIYRGKHQHPLS